MRIIILIGLILYSTLCYGQDDSRINKIRALYKNYNENLSQMDNYEIKLNIAGSYPSLMIHTDFNDKVLIKSADADEFGSSATEYYFLNDTIQFIYSKSERLLDHWGADTVRIQILELRFYFDKGKIIKTLKKKLTGIEGKDNKTAFDAIQNKIIDYKTDYDSNWAYFQERVSNLKKLYSDLKGVF